MSRKPPKVLSGPAEVISVDTCMGSAMNDATRTLYEHTGDKLLAFVVWQKLPKGGYLAIIPNSGIAANGRVAIEFFQDLQLAVSAIVERLSQ